MGGWVQRTFAEPDEAAAAAIGAETGGAASIATYNAIPQVRTSIIPSLFCVLGFHACLCLYVCLSVCLQVGGWVCVSLSVSEGVPLSLHLVVGANAYHPRGWQEVLQHLPGVTARNMHRLMRNVASLHVLAGMSEAALAAVLDSKAARELYGFLHRDARG